MKRMRFNVLEGHSTKMLGIAVLSMGQICSTNHSAYLGLLKTVPFKIVGGGGGRLEFFLNVKEKRDDVKKKFNVMGRGLASGRNKKVDAGGKVVRN